MLPDVTTDRPAETIEQLEARHAQELSALKDRQMAERGVHFREADRPRRERLARMRARRLEGTTWVALAREFGVGVRKAKSEVRMAERHAARGL